MKLYRPFDLVIVAVTVCICGFAFLQFRGAAGSFAEVYVEGRKAATFRLEVPDREKRIETPIGVVHIRYGNGSIRVTQSPCLQKICILQGAARHTHDRIICLPAHLHIRLFNPEETDAQNGIDAITY